MRQHAGGGNHLHHRLAEPGSGSARRAVARSGARDGLKLRGYLAGLFLGVLLATAGGCASLSQVGATADNGWAAALDEAQQAVIAGRYDDADHTLARYGEQHPGTSEAREAEYWRGVFKLDPANRSSSVTGAIASLDRYLAGPPTSPHWREAATLRRVAAQLETATRLAAAALTPTNVPRPVVVQDQGQADEIARLKAELAKANEELDRIKKRLAQPRP